MIFPGRGSVCPKKVLCLWLIGMLIAPVMGLAAVLDVSGLELSGDEITANVVLNAQSGTVQAAGFGLVYACDRMEYVGADTAGIRGMVQAKKDGCTVRIGYMAPPGTESKVVKIPLKFRPTGRGPYMVAVSREGLAGVEPSFKPGIVGDITAPQAWAVPGKKALLFVVVPGVSRIKSATVLYNGQNVLGPIVNAGQWHYDAARDVFFLSLPDIELPAGTYNLKVNLDYGASFDSLDVPVTITQ